MLVCFLSILKIKQNTVQVNDKMYVSSRFRQKKYFELNGTYYYPQPSRSGHFYPIPEFTDISF